MTDWHEYARVLQQRYFPKGGESAILYGYRVSCAGKKEEGNVCDDHKSQLQDKVLKCYSREWDVKARSSFETRAWMSAN